MFLSRAFSTICMSLNMHYSFQFTVDVNKDLSCIINLHRVSFSRPTAPIQCKFQLLSSLRFALSRF